jgi:hypothetical protein
MRVRLLATSGSYQIVDKCRNWRKERKRMYETFARNKILTPRPLEGAPEIDENLWNEGSVNGTFTVL